MSSGFWKKSKVIMCLVDTLCLLSARRFGFLFVEAFGLLHSILHVWRREGDMFREE